MTKPVPAPIPTELLRSLDGENYWLDEAHGTRYVLVQDIIDELLRLREAARALLGETAPTSGDFKRWGCSVCGSENDGDDPEPHDCEWWNLAALLPTKGDDDVTA